MFSPHKIMCYSGYVEIKNALCPQIEFRNEKWRIWELGEFGGNSPKNTIKEANLGNGEFGEGEFGEIYCITN